MRLEEFKKSKDFLVCVDSDGCAIDSMNIKHSKYFAPEVIREWKLGEWREEILEHWCYTNLYSKTRGINRFKGLLLTLTEVDVRYVAVDDLASLREWVEGTSELSNNSLKRAIEAKPESICLKKALSWSNRVNEAIKRLPEAAVVPFEAVRDALVLVHKSADVAVVSSANRGAIMNEWERHGLLRNVDLVLAQDSGTKAHCIGELLKKGYERERVLVCGDALSDMDAAERNGVLFYPIEVNRENESWAELTAVGFARLLDGSYSGEYQSEKNAEFIKNLSK